jgi:hypothetical protein
MNKYLVAIRIKGQVVKTTIEADSVIHAKLLGEWHYGIGSIASTPTRLAEQVRGASNLRLDALKRQKDNATQALKAERNRQKIQKAQQTIANITIEK